MKKVAVINVFDFLWLSETRDARSKRERPISIRTEVFC